MKDIFVDKRREYLYRGRRPPRIFYVCPELWGLLAVLVVAVLAVVMALTNR